MFGCPPQLKDTADPKSAGIANGRAALDQSGLREESDPTAGLLSPATKVVLLTPLILHAWWLDFHHSPFRSALAIW